MKINSRSIKKYSQPDFYHFSSDSIELAKKSFDFCIEKKIRPDTILDVGTGCGVVGAEFCDLLGNDPNLVGIDQEKEFESFFAINTKHLSRSKFIHENIFSNELSLNSKFDIVLSNPPYFNRGHGKLSSIEKKNSCRFFNEKESVGMFIKKAISFLKENGYLFILSRENRHLAYFETALLKRIKVSGAFLDIYQKKL